MRKNVSVMSHAELVCELITVPSSPVVADATANYAAARDKLLSPSCNAIVGRKLSVAKEILSRSLIAKMQAGPTLNSPDVVREWLKLRYAHIEHEVFIVLFLDIVHRLIAVEEVFRGTLAQTTVYSREIVKSALAHNAAVVMLAHNHPSGNPQPSDSDRRLTTHLCEALSLVDVRVLDHLIVGGDSIYSFAESGLL